MFGKGRQNLECDWNNLLSITFKGDRSEFLLLVDPPTSSSRLPILRRMSLSQGEPHCTAKICKSLAQPGRESSKNVFTVERTFGKGRNGKRLDKHSIYHIQNGQIRFVYHQLRPLVRAQDFLLVWRLTHVASPPRKELPQCLIVRFVHLRSHY